MALLLKRAFQGYSYLFDEVADPRAKHLFLMESPIPIIVIVALWMIFILKWGPAYMKDRKPFNLKRIMIVYNVIQIIANAYLLFYVWLGRNVVSWTCSEVDFSNSYWGLTFLRCTHLYFLLKLADLIDTVFFVLRKKNNHLSFLHIYHHFGMVLITWIGTKFVGGGHSYFLGLVNCPVHIILYSYYLLTAYDSRIGKLLWLKKFITQAQLLQFGFLTLSFGQLALRPDCKFPKLISFFLVPQNFFMMVLFGDFYIRTYISEPRRKRKELEWEMQELQEINGDAPEKKDL